MTEYVRVPREPTQAMLDAFLRCIPTDYAPDRHEKRAAYAAMLAASPQGEGLTVDALAQEIRRVDGSNTLGAGALAEALMPFLASYRVTEGVKP